MVIGKVSPGALPLRLHLVTQETSCIFKDVLRQHSPASGWENLENHAENLGEVPLVSKAGVLKLICWSWVQ